jgi:hypothetical protein
MIAPHVRTRDLCKDGLLREHSHSRGVPNFRQAGGPNSRFDTTLSEAFQQHGREPVEVNVLVPPPLHLLEPFVEICEPQITASIASVRFLSNSSLVAPIRMPFDRSSFLMKRFPWDRTIPETRRFRSEISSALGR